MLGTTSPVSQKIQAKFYVPADLWASAQGVMDQQGVDYSEVVTRLLRMLVIAPQEVRPLVLAQLPGNAASAVAMTLIVPKPYEVFSLWQRLDPAGRERAYEMIRDALKASLAGKVELPVNIEPTGLTGIVKQVGATETKPKHNGERKRRGA